MRPIAIIIAIIGLSSVVNAAPATTNARCTNLQARCAIEARGSCDMATGRSRYWCKFGRVYGPLQRVHLARSAAPSLTIASLGRLTWGSHLAADSQSLHN